MSPPPLSVAGRSRQRVLDVLVGHRTPATASDLSAWTGLHENTVRFHLAVLIDAGLVTRVVEQRRTRGRPRVMFRVTAPVDPDGPEPASPAPNGAPAAQTAASPPAYRLLVETILDHLVAPLPDGSQRARNAGEAWGRLLGMSRLTAGAGLDGETGARTSRSVVTAALAELRPLGFDAGPVEWPEQDDQSTSQWVAAAGVTRIEIRRCPYAESVLNRTETICALHAGLLRGLLATAGTDMEVNLDPMVTSDLCVGYLQPAPDQRPLD